MTTFAIATLGCKVNTYESSGYESALLEAGFEQVSFKEVADIYIINTCAVTNTAAAKSRQKIHQARAKNDNAIIAVVGCYAQSAFDQIEQMEGVDLVIGSQGKELLVDKIMALLSGQQIRNEYYDVRKMSVFEALDVRRFEHQTRAFLKIQDGCNQFCSYCIIPYTRGKERSLASDEVVKRAYDLVAHGHVEIVLAGIHTGRYGNGSEETLVTLLKRLLKEVPDLARIRISSIEMNEISDELIELMKQEPRIARHLHIPVQAACNSVLKNMNRPYTIEWFMERVEYIRNCIPNISISSDVIVGFPMESEEEFLETIANIKRMKLSFLHVFPYSKRDGTKAASMHGHFNNAIKKDRSRRLGDVSNALYNDFKQTFIGKEVSVVLEKQSDGYFIGHSSEYLEVHVLADASKLHNLCNVEITHMENGVLFGKQIGE